MSTEKPTNISASVRQRLLNLARERNDEFQLVLIRYGVERLLYRLSVSPHAKQFVLKGAMLFQLWTGQPHRPTLKDFYDLWVLARDFQFDGGTLGRAVRATFERRRTELPTTAPMALTSEFAQDRSKRMQWTAFVRRGRLVVKPQAFEQVVDTLHLFLWPLSASLVADTIFAGRWRPGSPWM